MCYYNLSTKDSTHLKCLDTMCVVKAEGFYAAGMKEAKNRLLFYIDWMNYFFHGGGVGMGVHVPASHGHCRAKVHS